MNLLIAFAVSLLLVCSGILALTGSIGLLRMSSFFRRIHAPTLGNTAGVFFVLVATILLASTSEHRLVIHPIIITLFLIITSPVSAMLLMRAAIRRKARELHQDPGDIILGPSDGPAAPTQAEATRAADEEPARM